MKFKKDFLRNYIKEGPLPLAIERSLECEIMARQVFERPILDIGCGEGLFSYILFDEPVDVGIDPNEKEIERAKAYAMYTEFIQCSGEKIPKEDGKFNTIFSNSVLEHIPDVELVLTEAKRLLSNNGSFYVTVPTDKFDKNTSINKVLTFLNMHGLAQKYRDFFNNFWRHYHYYSVEKWKTLFEKCGFMVLETIEYDSRDICIIDDFLAPFCFFEWVTKKVFNKWILFPGLRNIFLSPAYLLSCSLIKRFEDKKECGIVFFHLKKNLL